MYYKELSNKLQRKVPYQWRVQSRTKDKKKAMCSAYIDARDVQSILDEHCENGWSVEYKEICGFIFAGIGITDDQGKTIWKWECGQRIEQDPQDQMYDQAGKSASSDAFKRAAVMWGIGRFIYEMDMVTLPCDENGNVIDEQGKRVWNLTAHINKTNEPLPALTGDKLDAMLKFIGEGKIKEVESALSKYFVTDAQRTVITASINNKKTASVVAAAKK
jgi:hypothetical protein